MVYLINQSLLLGFAVQDARVLLLLLGKLLEQLMILLQVNYKKSELWSDVLPSCLAAAVFSVGLSHS